MDVAAPRFTGMGLVYTGEEPPKVCGLGIPPPATVVDVVEHAFRPVTEVLQHAVHFSLVVEAHDGEGAGGGIGNSWTIDPDGVGAGHA